MAMLSVILLLTSLVSIQTIKYRGWKKIEGAQAYDISSKGTDLWHIGNSQTVWRWDTDIGQWIQVRGAYAVNVATTQDGWVWAVTGQDEVYRYSEGAKVRQRLPGSLMQISAASRDRAIGVNRNGQVWIWDEVGNFWRPQPGIAVWASIGENDERWHGTVLGEIFRWNSEENNWDRVEGRAALVDVQSPTKVVKTGVDGSVAVWQNQTWVQVPGDGLPPGGCKKTTINSPVLYCIAKDQSIWKNAEVGTRFRETDAGERKSSFEEFES